MDPAFLKQYWAPLAASVLGVGILLLVIRLAWRDSARGRLRGAAGELRRTRQEVAKLETALVRAEKTLARLESKADSVRPRSIEEAREAVSDRKALLKIRGDEVLVAQTRARKIIFEEFPPRRHETLRRRYIGD